MKRAGFIIVAALLALFSCSQPGSKSSGSTSDQAKQSVEKEKKEAERQKDEFVRQAQEKLDQLDKQIDDLKAQAKKANAQTQKQINKSIAELEPKRRDAERRLERLKSSSGKAWEDMKAGVIAALNDLSTAYRRAASRFK